MKGKHLYQKGANSVVDKGYIADIVIALNNIYKNEDSAIWFKAESGANDGTE